MTFDLILKNGALVFPGEGVRSGSIAVKDGKIAAILAAEPALRPGLPRQRPSPPPADESAGRPERTDA